MVSSSPPKTNISLNRLSIEIDPTCSNFLNVAKATPERLLNPTWVRLKASRLSRIFAARVSFALPGVISDIIVVFKAKKSDNYYYYINNYYRQTRYKRTSCLFIRCYLGTLRTGRLNLQVKRFVHPKYIDLLNAHTRESHERVGLSRRYDAMRFQATAGSVTLSPTTRLLRA